MILMRLIDSFRPKESRRNRGQIMRLIDADALRVKMYDEAFETDTDEQRWDSGCWIRYRMFERNVDDAPTIDAIPVEWIKQKQSEIPASSSWNIMMQFLMDLWKEEQEADHG